MHENGLRRNDKTVSWQLINYILMQFKTKWANLIPKNSQLGNIVNKYNFSRINMRSRVNADQPKRMYYQCGLCLHLGAAEIF